MEDTANYSGVEEMFQKFQIEQKSWQDEKSLIKLITKIFIFLLNYRNLYLLNKNMELTNYSHYCIKITKMENILNLINYYKEINSKSIFLKKRKCI